MKIKGFWLGLAITNVIIMEFSLHAIIVYPKIINQIGYWKINILFSFMLIGIIANFYNAFENEK